MPSLSNARIAGALGALVVIVLTAAWFFSDGDSIPEGIVWGNGRLEADQVDIAAKLSGRVAEVLASEGDMVAQGQRLAAMDVAELSASHERAQAETALAEEQLAEAEALVIQRQSELRLAERELDRARPLLAKGHMTEAVYEDRETSRDVAAATLRAAKARVNTATRQIAAHAAETRRIQTQIDDSVLTAPVDGRVLYRLAEPGEVIAGGGAILTLLSLEDVYMEVFLPAEDAGRLAIGADARIVLDVLPEYSIPAEVSFVSPEAQFTPKQVETLEEREKLVFRVKVKIPPDLVRKRIEHVKTGVRGLAYVKMRPSLEWPEALDRRIPPELFD
ncbi:MAG: HlyD family efflux transporter periplasmic adaptor subunit [Pseudomonadota bacterium]